MSKHKAALVLFLTAAILTLRAAPLRAQVADSDVNIGVIVPLTGDMAVHGVEIQRAMQLALNEASGKHYRYKLQFEDNRLDSAQSVAAALRLLDISKVDVVVTLWPPTAAVVIPLSEKRERLHYTISWDPELARRNHYVLSHQVMVDDIVRASLALLRDKGITRAAFLHMEETGFNLGAAYFRALSGGAGIELAADEAFPPDGTDFRSLLDRVAARRPEAYIVWAVMPSMDLVIRQLRQRNPRAFITGYLDYAQNLSPLDGAEYVSEMYAANHFAAAFRAAYGVDPMSKGANAYDIVKLIIGAYEQHQDARPDTAAVKQTLLAVRDYPGAVGRFSIDQWGNSTYSPVRRRIAGGKRTAVE